MHSIILILVVSLIAVTGSFQTSEDCPHYSGSAACEHFRMPREFPSRPRQLDRACQLYLRNMNCSEKYEERCGYDPKRLQDIKRDIGIARRVCKKGSALYNAISSELPCIKKQFYEAKCSLYELHELRQFESLLEENGVTVTPTEDYNAGHCADHLHSYACISAWVGLECSAEARDAVTEVYQTIIFPSRYCTDESVNKLPEIVKILEEDLLI